MQDFEPEVSTARESKLFIKKTFLSASADVQQCMRLLAQRPRAADGTARVGQNRSSEIDYSANGAASTVGAATAEAFEVRLVEVGVRDTHG